MSIEDFKVICDEKTFYIWDGKFLEIVEGKDRIDNPKETLPILPNNITELVNLD